ncbi:helix-turn-helix domain-containing protein [Antrihabitans spumae]|uniref:Helix-turn-helix domain-containing protein n=1 Tax=Antrihabitans spumae TaxID=3373370 RepID=A0ABW7KJL1_9NOCA
MIAETGAVQSPWMTVPEAAQYARCGHGLVYEACRTGELKANQAGQHAGRRGKWRIHRDAIDEWLGSPATTKRPRHLQRSA